MASKVSVSLPERRVKAHYGGTMVMKGSNNGPLYDYEGGDVSYVGIISGVLDFDQFLKMMTSSFNRICEGNFHVYALSDGIRFRVDNVDDISFLWEILPVDEEGFTHLYCCNEQSTIKETSIAGIMPTVPTEIQPLPPASEHSAPLSFTSFITTHFGSKSASCTPVKKLPVKRKFPDLIIENYESSQFQFDDFTQNPTCDITQNPTFPTQQSQVVGNVSTSEKEENKNQRKCIKDMMKKKRTRTKGNVSNVEHLGTMLELAKVDQLQPINHLKTEETKTEHPTNP